ncbi:peptidyl-prolyl cis-trans isomerase [Cesiribacter sp. SM1]|uniref:peptidyl-prolyl cis-trans isomerase n=1 Tax=Cesiribacter sp. SM1 TaxID=2861196 RepID=UPI001CD19661|nr:peptidyl-prolyl cis-trans isomerase [Cesiribacter sp. SM1]
MGRVDKYLVIVLVLFLAGCDFFRPKTDSAADGEKVVARVHDQYLYLNDLAELLPQGINADDSSRMADRYIRSWVRKQLLISEAARKIELDQQELERKVQDYRYSLMIYEYEKQYVGKHLDRSVSEEEVQQYYENNKDNFQLKQNIIRGLFVKVPLNAPKLSNLREFMPLNKAGDREKVKSYAYRFATDYMLDDGVWVNFDELIMNTPLAGIPNKVQWLKNNKYAETADEEYVYFLKIQDYKITDEISPLEFVRDQIETIIVSRRKTELASRLEEEIYENARKNNAFEVYEK